LIVEEKRCFFLEKLCQMAKLIHEFEDEEELLFISWRTGIFYARQVARIFFFPLLWNLG
jgi:hypothetical protein